MTYEDWARKKRWQDSRPKTIKWIFLEDGTVHSLEDETDEWSQAYKMGYEQAVKDKASLLLYH